MEIHEAAEEFRKLFDRMHEEYLRSESGDSLQFNSLWLATKIMAAFDEGAKYYDGTGDLTHARREFILNLFKGEDEQSI